MDDNQIQSQSTPKIMSDNLKLDWDEPIVERVSLRETKTGTVTATENSGAMWTQIS